VPCGTLTMVVHFHNDTASSVKPWRCDYSAQTYCTSFIKCFRAKSVYIAVIKMPLLIY